jgi:hypothetical protein
MTKKTKTRIIIALIFIGLYCFFSYLWGYDPTEWSPTTKALAFYAGSMLMLVFIIPESRKPKT